MASGVVVTKTKWWKLLWLNNGSMGLKRLSDKLEWHFIWNSMALSSVYHSSFTVPNWYLSLQQVVATVDHKTRPPTYWLTTSRFFLLVTCCRKWKTRSVIQKVFDWHFGQRQQNCLFLTINVGNMNDGIADDKNNNSNNYLTVKTCWNLNSVGSIYKRFGFFYISLENWFNRCHWFCSLWSSDREIHMEPERGL